MVVEMALCPVTVGREAEMQRLAEALQGARAGQSRTVVVTGDAGLGKTRLAADLRRLAGEQGMAAMWGGCSEAELSLPYLPFLEAIGNHLAQADLTALRPQVAAYRELAWLFPQLGLEEPPRDPSDPVQGKMRLFEAVLALLRTCAQPAGLLLVLENLHWADASSRELLEYLVRRLLGARVMLLVTCRLDGLDRRHSLRVAVDQWRRAGLVERVDLSPLTTDRVGEMIRATVGIETVGLEVRRLLRDRSEGNPFVLEEILKEALDRGAVSRHDPVWRHESLQRLRLPRTVRDSVLGRLAHLPEEAAEVLRCASVLGRSFDYPLLVAISGCAPPQVQAAFRTCVQQQLLEEDPDVDGQYRFRHSLTRESVYDDLLAPQRQDLHAAAAEALRARPGTPDVELCQHLLAARREQEAVPVGLAAAEQAMRTHAYQDAVRLYERILPLVDDDARPALVCSMGMAHLLGGDVARAEGLLVSGVRALELLGRNRAAASYRLWLGRCHRERNRPDLAAAEYEAARAVLEPGGPGEDLALAYVRLASAAIFDLDGARTVEMAERAIEIATEAGADAPRIWAYSYLGLGLIQLERVAEGLAAVDRSQREAAAAGLNVIASTALSNGIWARLQQFRPLEALERVAALKAMQAGSMAQLQALRAEGGVHLWGLGRPARALQALEEALALARDWQATYHVNWLQVQLAIAHLQLDHLDVARQLLPDRKVAREGQDRVDELWAEIRLSLDSKLPEAALPGAGEVLRGGTWPMRVQLFLSDVAAEALVAAGRAGDAQTLVDRMVAGGAAPGHPWLLRMQGRVAAVAGRPDEATDRLRGAAAAFGAAGLRHEEARTRLALAAVLAETGAVESAQGELRAALESAEERGAAFEARAAREALTALGSQTTTVERVKQALEALHRPQELAHASLRHLVGLEADRDGARLRALLVEQMGQLVSSPDSREHEAGQLLVDYYLRRVGSHEVIAERMHLTRATFYRRLQLGLSLLGERLTTMG
ncbi:MAG TPA: AAA family ATPase [Candidatus Dormibacteraeota bacterium]